MGPQNLYVVTFADNLPDPHPNLHSRECLVPFLFGREQ